MLVEGLIHSIQNTINNKSLTKNIQGINSYKKLIISF